MKGRTWIIALIIAAALAGLVVLFLSTLKSQYETSTRMVNVYLSKKHIEQGSMLTKDMVDLVKVPSQYIQPKALKKEDIVFDKDGQSIYVTTAPVSKGEQIMFTKLMNLGMESGLSFIVPAEKRAIALEIAEPIVNYLKPGDHVDVVLMTKLIKRGEGMAKLRLIPLLENVQVIAKGQKVFGMVAADDGSKGDNMLLKGLSETDKNKNVIAVAVLPEEASLISIAQQQGTVTVLLRALGDLDELKMDPIDIESWLNQKYNAGYVFGTPYVGGGGGAGGGFGQAMNMQSQMMDMFKSYTGK